ncbi:MAG: hypothetical protein QMB94_08640 [Phycisphaerales bacterium]
MHRRRSILLFSTLCAAVTGSAFAAPPSPLDIRTRRVHQQRVVLDRSDASGGGIAGGCDPVVVAHTSSDFGAGEYIAQGGFIEGEIAATSFQIPADAFPVRLDLFEAMFATSSAAVETTTEYAIYVWSGYPDSGTLEFSVASDGDLLPHIMLPPGTSGLQLQFLVDPDDPDQVWIPDNGSHVVTVGIEIVAHHQPPSNQCLTAPDPLFNAFPCTDVDGLQSSTGNWIFVQECGIFGCPAGWKRFSDLPSICRPSGDWVQRLTWSPSGCDSLGACCIGGTCATLYEITCLDAGGVFQGVGVSCGSVNCEATVPCCFPSTGGCVQLTAADCFAVQGIPGPAGETCASHVCFPQGACCLPDGTCSGIVSPEECAAMGGAFQGDGTDCATTDCPEPVGAACFDNDFCLILTEADAIAAGANWKGTGTTCEDLDGNGVADACEVSDLPGDLNGDGLVNGVDLGLFLVGWGQPGPTDLDGDGTTNGVDLGVLLVDWTG